MVMVGSVFLRNLASRDLIVHVILISRIRKQTGIESIVETPVLFPVMTVNEAKFKIFYRMMAIKFQRVLSK